MSESSKESEKSSKNVLDCATSDELAQIRELADRYMGFLREHKADRERVAWARGLAGARELELGGEGALRPGDRFFYANRGKAAVLGVVGTDPAAFSVIGTHVDYPHIDLKPRFAHEMAAQGACVLQTHYYGGIKKYVYQTTPLLLKVHCVQDGRSVTHTIGQDPADPVFTMPDLLVHLGAAQADRKTADVVKADEMQALAGTSRGGEATFTRRFLQLLEERTGLREEDLPYCEFQLYPAQEPRYVGLDRGAIGAPGQDDGACTFAAVDALMAAQAPRYTAVVVLHSYEETGSNGCTGAQSEFLPMVLKDVLRRQDVPEYKHGGIFTNSITFAGDVTSLYDVNFTSPFDNNAAVINRGVVINRYCGKGKSGCVELSTEALFMLRKIANGVPH